MDYLIPEISTEVCLYRLTRLLGLALAIVAVGFATLQHDAVAAPTPVTVSH